MAIVIIRPRALFPLFFVFSLFLALQGGVAVAFSVGRAAPSKNADHIVSARKAAMASSSSTSTNLEEAMSIHLPINWQKCNSKWAKEAASILKEHGVVIIMNQGRGLIEKTKCDNANVAAESRLNDMQRRLESRGLDPTGQEELYRFSEIVCRDDGGRRYDIPVSFLGESELSKVQNNSKKVGSSRMGTPLEPHEEDAIASLHRSISEIVQPVISSLWSNEKYTSSVAASGFLINTPGSVSQNWHRDGPDEGYIDCFVPLVDLTESIGPTAIKPGTHSYIDTVDSASNFDVLVPMLTKGEILLFDYRTIHRGQGNRSKSTTRTLAYAVYKRQETGKEDLVGDIRNFPAALTLEYD